MRKSTLFVSVVLTTFMLAVLFGVVSAYKNIVASTETAAVEVQAPATTAVEMVSQPVAVVPTQVVPTQAANVAPEAAASIASKVLGRTDLYSVELTQFEGKDAYLVTFSSGDLVYLSLDGQILSISKLAVTVITQRRGGGNDDEPVVSNTTTTTTTDTGGGDDDHEEHDGGDSHEGGDD